MPKLKRLELVELMKLLLGNVPVLSLLWEELVVQEVSVTTGQADSNVEKVQEDSMKSRGKVLSVVASSYLLPEEEEEDSTLREEEQEGKIVDLDSVDSRELLPSKLNVKVLSGEVNSLLVNLKLLDVLSNLVAPMKVLGLVVKLFPLLLLVQNVGVSELVSEVPRERTVSSLSLSIGYRGHE